MVMVINEVSTQEAETEIPTNIIDIYKDDSSAKKQGK